MSESKHNLPAAFKRLENQITGTVADAIAIEPRSHGTLSLNGEYSTSNRPPAHQVGRPGSSSEKTTFGITAR